MCLSTWLDADQVLLSNQIKRSNDSKYSTDLRMEVTSFEFRLDRILTWRSNFIDGKSSFICYANLQIKDKINKYGMQNTVFNLSKMYQLSIPNNI